MMKKIELNRLQKLHDFVKSHVAPKYFDMNFYRGDHNGEGHFGGVNQCTLEEKTCGTTGCLMGWTPFALKSTMYKEKLIPKRKTSDVNWNKAAMKLFGIKNNEPRWYYLFSDEWSYEGERKLQKKQALKRIRNMIASKGELTDAMKEEMRDASVYHGVNYDN